MRGVALGILAAIGINAIVCAAPAVASRTAANPSYVPPTAAGPLFKPAIASVLPARGDVVGVGHPVVVTFSAPVADKRAAERAIDITSVPTMTGKFEWLDNAAVQWIPDQFWPAHSTIALSVGGVKTEFVTGRAVIGTASISEHTFTVSIDGVDTGPPIELPAPHHRPNWGKPGVFPASMGRPEYPTPVGTYTVLAKERDVVMDSSSVGIPIDDPDGYLVTVEYAVRFTRRGLFVHSAPWNVNVLGYENVSHGCVGLSTEDAEWYFNTVNVGDPIIVQENSTEVSRMVTG
ncbi:L,D-transpeptidase family protein [Mycolicibacterium novocastrense]|uniref:Conserved exported protein n=1 Tax=Mycolicibacterium novocastrense TaxID=59813 RepID=A0AAW5SQP6_MYCNV|nr:L,D-transpeptidase family protein [Mycolicibacterium novocastrense]MCV7025614.1 L,D-transpeptidase family protein [Mycolicibacterium novocastrense]GAT07962.1 conserved exported protein [Mycolicibacterium novocastrense]